MTIENFLSKLEKVRSRGNGQWMACCPAGDDRTPSLSIKDDNGTIIMRCFAQECAVSDIVAAVGMELHDLFPPSNGYDAAHHKSGKRVYFNPGQVLEALAFETLVTYMIAKDMQTNGIDEPTRARLLTATSRINAALGYIRR